MRPQIDNMSKQTDFMLKALHVLTWIIFVGLCIEACGVITHMIATLTLTPEAAAKFWKEIDLSLLYQHNESHYVVLTSIIIIATLLKALIFYCILRVFNSKKINLASPFNEAMRKSVLLIAYLSLGVGIYCLWGSRFAEQLVKDGFVLPDTQKLRLGGADVWLFMGFALLVIAYMFKRGIEIQKENELTV